MTSRERVRATLEHDSPDRIPLDFGASSVTGVHASCVAALREYYRLEKRPVKVHEPYQMLGLVEEDLQEALGVDVQGVFRRKTLFGFANENWKPWRMPDGLEVLVSDRLHARIGNAVDAVFLCGTDFGTQNSTFCSVDTFREVWFPYYKRINDWIHQHTAWKCFKHSCGSVERFIPLFIEAGFDILNPVQCSAANMDPRHLKDTYGDRIVFWGGGVDTQKTLPFGSPAQVREEVLRRCEIFSKHGGFVFNTIHNIQAKTPVENIVAMIEAVREFNGDR